MIDSKMHFKRIVPAFLGTLFVPYILMRIIPGSLVLDLFLSAIVLPMLFGWYGRRFCNLGEVPMLLAAALVPLILWGVFLLQTNGQQRLPFVAPAVLLWIAFSALGWQFAGKNGKAAT